jgi:hypothetical protein
MRNFEGGPVQTFEFEKPASVGTAIFRNDAVCVVTGNKIQPGRATAFVGVALNGGAASTLTTHLVIASARAVFEAQDNGATDGIAAADLGKNADISTAVAGNAATGMSGQQISEASVATTAGLDLQLLGLHDVPDNEHGQYARIEVMFNRHFFNLGRTGV